MHRVLKVDVFVLLRKGQTALNRAIEESLSKDIVAVVVVDDGEDDGDGEEKERETGRAEKS